MEHKECYEPTRVQSIDFGSHIGGSIASHGSPGGDNRNIDTEIFLRDCDAEAGFLRSVYRDNRRGRLSGCGTDRVLSEVDARRAAPPDGQDAFLGGDD